MSDRIICNAEAMDFLCFFFSSRRRHTRLQGDWSSDVCSSDLPWVSRGGVKLEAALEHFGFDAAGRVCLDVGASTGGFTEVLLARVARRIYAVDVGRGQLHARLRAHPAVVPLEQTDIRTLDPALLAELPDFVTVDVSFISLNLV